MSVEYKNTDEVPNNVLCGRLIELAKYVAQSDFRDFGMRVPAEVDRDADLVISGAATRIIKQKNEIELLHTRLKEKDEALQELQNKLVEVEKDSKMIDWLEEQAKASQTGISFDYRQYVEDGQVIEKGYRFMRRHFLGDRCATLRKAIDTAIQQAKMKGE